MQSASLVHRIVVSVPAHAGAAIMGLQVTGSTLCTVPSGHWEKPDGVPWLVGRTFAPAHTGSMPPPPVVLEPPRPPVPAAPPCPEVLVAPPCPVVVVVVAVEPVAVPPAPPWPVFAGLVPHAATPRPAAARIDRRRRAREGDRSMSASPTQYNGSCGARYRPPCPGGGRGVYAAPPPAPASPAQSGHARDENAWSALALLSRCRATRCRRHPGRSCVRGPPETGHDFRFLNVTFSSPLDRRRPLRSPVA